jgi:hypothetical protein
MDQNLRKRLERLDRRISAKLDRIESLLAAFDERPTVEVWRKLRAAHRRYLTTHTIFPGSREHQVIARLWLAVWRGPFLVRGTTPEAVQTAIQAKLGTGEEIRIAVPFTVGERRLLGTYPCKGAEESWYTSLEDWEWSPSDGRRVEMLTSEQVAAALSYLVRADERL